MAKSPETFSGEAGGLPEEVRQAFLEILFHTLCYIRAFVKHPDLCHALADHAHNIPSFLKRPEPELLRFYWKVERPPFLEKMDALKQKVGIFEPAWKIIEQEYEKLKAR